MTYGKGPPFLLSVCGHPRSGDLGIGCTFLLHLNHIDEAKTFFSISVQGKLTYCFICVLQIGRHTHLWFVSQWHPWRLHPCVVYPTYLFVWDSPPPFPTLPNQPTPAATFLCPGLLLKQGLLTPAAVLGSASLPSWRQQGRQTFPGEHQTAPRWGRKHHGAFYEPALARSLIACCLVTLQCGPPVL